MASPFWAAACGTALLSYVLHVVQPHELLLMPCAAPSELLLNAFGYTCEAPIVVVQTWCDGVEYNSTVRLQVPTRRRRRRLPPADDLEGRPGSALAAVAHWHYGRPEKDAIRQGTLRRVLGAFALYPVRVTAMLVANARVDAVDDLVSEQLIRPRPRCTPDFEHNHCLQWEAIYAMRARGEAFDYYLLTESDVEVPAATFRFWQRNAERLYRRGYLLEPFRVEHRRDGERVLTECRVDTECLRYATAFRDPEAGTADADATGGIFIRPPDPSAGGWLLTRAQFADFLASNASSVATMAWPGRLSHPGEAAAHAPALFVNGDPCLGSYGPWFNQRGLTHLHLPAVHHHPAGREVAAYNLRLFEEVVHRCADLDAEGSGCPVL